MVMRYGFSSLGPFALEEEGEEVFLGRDWIRSSPHTSVRTGNRIDEQVRGLASEALERAMAVLTPRRALIDDLVNRLIEMETIDGDSFRTLVEAHEAAGGSALAAQAGSKADVEASQVGV
jgi:cell division protease FtsH